MHDDFEMTLRAIIRNEYGHGNQNISSAELFERLVQKGVSVPEVAMAEILEKLHKQVLTKGAFVLDREEARKHGACSIMWVSRYI